MATPDTNSVDSQDPMPCIAGGTAHDPVDWDAHLSVGSINCAAISDPFAVSAWVVSFNVGQSKFAGAMPVLSRWHTAGCANCQKHLDVRGHFPLLDLMQDEAERTTFEIRVYMGDNPFGAPHKTSCDRGIA
ncbi:Tyrosinase [Madurella mycetomatis]|uniref:Tyrosinase n=1 Tax=Madurella mycetomatis TaxID=100816 RepID=A0A175VRT6_9PEZI|nr:Tyrosinase [Madurella mycetomatis]